jgi:hypothetical protein
MKESEITDEQIIEEVQEILSNPQLRKCSQCANSNEECTWCSQMNKPLAKFMYAGMCKHFETDEERIIRQTRENLKRQEKEEHKVNHLLTMALNCIDASMLFLEDFAQRVEKEYKIAELKGTGDPRVRKADRTWIGNLKKANKAMLNNIDGARKQFQHYVMPIYNKVFYDKEVKQYDVEMYDDHQSDCTELAHLVLRYFDVAFLNKSNADAVIELMKSMKSCGVMEESDFNHYNFRR